MTRLIFDDLSLDIAPEGDGYSISLDDQVHRAETLEITSGRLSLVMDGRRSNAFVTFDGQRRWVTVGGRTFVLTKSSASRRGLAAHEGSSELSAPMPGQVRTINIAPGDAVTKGQVLVVLEAMKMEIRMHAPFDGVVSSVDAKVGQTVEREQILVKLHQGHA